MTRALRLLATLLLAVLPACDLSSPLIEERFRNRAVSVPVLAFAGRTAGEVSAGYFHTCAVGTGGELACTGANPYHQLGVTTQANNCDAQTCAFDPVTVPSPVSFAHVFAGATHSCGLTAAGAAWCWGEPYPGDDVGPLGGGTVQRSAAPVAVAGGLTFRTLSVGIAESCGLATDGRVFCWGRNWNGEVGDGTTTARAEPVAVNSALTFTALDVGDSHSCAIDASGRAHCWGVNQFGQLGIGPVTQANIRATSPVPVTGDRTFTQVSAGGTFTCALDAGGAAYCWGDNRFGQLGALLNQVYSPEPIAVAGGLAFVGISAGASHACAVQADGQAWCWGSDYFGSLGAAGTPFSSAFSPVPVQGPAFVGISAGGSHTCAVTAAGAIWCWGDRLVGQQGTGAV